ARRRHPVARHRRRPVQADDGRPTDGDDTDAQAAETSGGAAMTVLELRGVSKRYGEGAGEVQALREVDLAVDGGELVAVMGPSGSGKSTLLTIAGSLEQPSSGEVFIGDLAVSGMSRNERAGLRRRAVGYVFQDFNLLAGLT